MMFISIVENRSGEQLLLRRLAPNESCDPEKHARKWMEQAYCGELRIADSSGYIPRGCADFYAETRDTKEATGVCWQSFDFYVESGDE